jgi:P27 family predicted phage terminase small subunit
MKHRRVLTPKHLNAEARKLWTGILMEYEIEDSAGLRILRVACEAYQRAQACREVIDSEGMQRPDRFGVMKPHPLLAAERDARSQFLQGLKSLNLDLEPLRDGPGRPCGK